MQESTIPSHATPKDVTQKSSPKAAGQSVSFNKSNQQSKYMSRAVQVRGKWSKNYNSSFVYINSNAQLRPFWLKDHKYMFSDSMSGHTLRQRTWSYTKRNCQNTTPEGNSKAMVNTQNRNFHNDICVSYDLADCGKVWWTGTLRWNDKD